jgi:uncharacterized protein YycO
MTVAVTPQAGSIGVTPSHGWVAAGIRLVTRGPFAHSFIATGRGFEVIEGDPHGARPNDARHYRKVVWLEALTAGMTLAEREAAVAWAVAHLGTPYSWIDDFLIGWRDLFRFALPFSKRRMESDATLMCSQLCVAALRAGGRDLAPGKPDGGISPNDLWRLNQRFEKAAA